MLSIDIRRYKQRTIKETIFYNVQLECGRKIEGEQKENSRQFNAYASKQLDTVYGNVLEGEGEGKEKKKGEIKRARRSEVVTITHQIYFSSSIYDNHALNNQIKATKH